MTTMQRPAVAGGMLLAVLFASVPKDALAVPAFARRFGTSCQTCHVAFPKLTPFGEAFRRNGYHFPGGQDEDVRKVEPQRLGADANRDVFPESVWPGELPSEVPISAFLLANAVLTPQSEPGSRFALSSASMGLNAAATLGEVFSAWAGASVTVSADGNAQAAIERAFLLVKPMEEPWVTFRAGIIEPNILSFTSHRSLGPMPWISTTRVGDNELAVEPSQLGLEVAGVALEGRGSYAFGLVEGSGNQTGVPSDVYGRLAAKIGGMRLDGETSGDEAAVVSPAPWSEWSVQAGAFGWAGLAEIGDPASASQDDRFFKVGGDVNAQLGDASVVLAYAFGRNSRPFLADASLAAESHLFHLQVDYVLFPWLVPSLRAERRVVAGVSQDRLVPMVYVLLRANVRSQVFVTLERNDAGTVRLERAQAGLAVGF